MFKDTKRAPMVVKESAVLFIFISIVIKIIIQIVNHVIDIIIFRIPLPQEVWDRKIPRTQQGIFLYINIMSERKEDV